MPHDCQKNGCIDTPAGVEHRVVDEDTCWQCARKLKDAKGLRKHLKLHEILVRDEKPGKRAIERSEEEEKERKRAKNRTDFAKHRAERLEKGRKRYWANKQDEVDVATCSDPLAIAQAALKKPKHQAALASRLRDDIRSLEIGAINAFSEHPFPRAYAIQILSTAAAPVLREASVLPMSVLSRMPWAEEPALDGPTDHDGPLTASLSDPLAHECLLPSVKLDSFAIARFLVRHATLVSSFQQSFHAWLLLPSIELPGNGRGRSADHGGFYKANTTGAKYANKDEDVLERTVDEEEALLERTVDEEEALLEQDGEEGGQEGAAVMLGGEGEGEEALLEQDGQEGGKEGAAVMLDESDASVMLLDNKGDGQVEGEGEMRLNGQVEGGQVQCKEAGPDGVQRQDITSPDGVQRKDGAGREGLLHEKVVRRRKQQKPAFSREPHMTRAATRKAEEAGAK